ncbi:uncharacterized protein [Clytia hemisphaerica]|uniref:Uncharacterized protein n=1 Tax=Clytia hemisphaerica TaxID=252671 RepID=A0A7M5X5C5_9CNID
MAEVENEKMDSCPFCLCRKKVKQSSLLSHTKSCKLMQKEAEDNIMTLQGRKIKCSEAYERLLESRDSVTNANKLIGKYNQEIENLTGKLKILKPTNKEVSDFEESELQLTPIKPWSKYDRNDNQQNSDSMTTLLLDHIKGNNQQALTYLLIKYNKKVNKTDLIILFTKALRLCTHNEIHVAIPILLHYHPEILDIELPEFQDTKPVYAALSKGNIILFKYLLDHSNQIDLGNVNVDMFQGLKGDEKKMVKKLLKKKMKLCGDTKS